MFQEMLRRFMDEAPVCVAVRAVAERLLSTRHLDELFREVARHQYESKLLFSTVVQLIGQVVAGPRRSVHEAYQHAGDVGVSVAAVYDKLNGMEPAIARAMVRAAAPPKARRSPGTCRCPRRRCRGTNCGSSTATTWRRPPSTASRNCALRAAGRCPDRPWSCSTRGGSC